MASFCRYVGDCAVEERKPMANITPFGLRMQPDLKARVEAAAKKSGRSLNAEIVARLEQAYPAPRPNDGLLDFWLQAIASAIADGMPEDQLQHVISTANDDLKDMFPKTTISLRDGNIHIDASFLRL